MRLDALGATGASKPRYRRMRLHGATTIEFSLVLILGVLPLVLGILQVAMLLAARNTVNWATFMAARQGALAGAEWSAMSRELARGLLPLYVPANRGGIVAADRMAAAYAEALADVIRLDSLIVHNPSRSALERYGIFRQGKRVIPNDYIEHRSVGVQDANILTISVVHCQPLVVPLVGPSLAAALRFLNGDPRQSSCLEAGRAPIMARASVVMQTDVQGEALR